MSKPILDQFDDDEDRFDNDSKIITIKFFNFESKAQLYVARLNEVGIKSFLSNTNASTVLPLSEGNIGLNVKDKDVVEALKIVKTLDENARKERKDLSYRDADLEEILYEKSLSEKEHFLSKPFVALCIIIIFLLLLKNIFGGAILTPSWWEF